LDKVISLEIDDKEVVERLEGRRIHEPSGRSYHLRFNPPKVAEKDDVTGEALVQRPDDKKEAITKRLENYHSKTKLVLSYFEKKGILSKINANQPINKVWDDVNKSLN